MKQVKKGWFRSGTSGLVLPVPNKQFFPPAFRDKSRLAYYSSLFNSIEINSSFYKLPQGVTVKKRADSVPEGFVFTFKLWQEITHVKGLAYDPGNIARFMEVVSYAGDKKGGILAQFPPSVTVEKFVLVERMLDLLQAYDWQVALEFRHPSWYISEVYELADHYASSMVLHDMPASRNTQLNRKAAFVYLRFHGPAGDYKGGYTHEFLYEQAVLIRKWITEGKAVYVYFNNTAGDAVSDLVTLNNFLTDVAGV